MVKFSGAGPLGEVMDKVENISEHCWDSSVERKDISFENLERINISGTSHYLRPVAGRAISARLGVPYHYLRKCPQNLQEQNLNFWITKEKTKKFFVRFDGDEVRAVFSTRYTPCDNKIVMQHLFKAGYSQNATVKYYLDGEFFSVSIPDGSKAFTIGGDKISPGISISNSEIGLSSLQITAWFYRLVCSNGLIFTDGVTESYRHISTRVLNEFPQVIQNISDSLLKHRDRFRLSVESPVENPESTILSFNRQFALGAKEVEAVNWAVSQEVQAERATMFQVIQVYTHAADFPSLSAESSFKLQKTGGDILSLVQ